LSGVTDGARTRDLQGHNLASGIFWENSGFMMCVLVLFLQSDTSRIWCSR
jgi:hypothetical protein